MAIKRFSVTLDEFVVKEIKEIFDKKGKKLSPVINQFLIQLIEEERKNDINSGN